MFRYDRRRGYYNLSNYKNTKNLSGLFEYDFNNFNLKYMSLTSFFFILGQWTFQQILDLYEINGVLHVQLSSVKSDEKIELSPFLSTMNRIKQGTERGTEPQTERGTELRTERGTEWGTKRVTKQGTERRTRVERSGKQSGKRSRERSVERTGERRGGQHVEGSGELRETWGRTPSFFNIHYDPHPIYFISLCSI